MSIYPGETKIVSFGLKVIIPDGYDLVVREKSGLASKGIIIGAGEVDNGYRGPMVAVIRYLRRESYPPFFILVGQKICQGRLIRKINTTIQEIAEEEFSTDTDRGEKGFGSSGT